MTDRSFCVGILACGHVSAELREASGGRDYGDVYGDFLRGADPSLATRVYDAIGGELPTSTDECDGWIITGSPSDAHGDAEWVVGLRAFVRRLAEDRARTVGICFGHQVVAQALGGRVERAGIWKAGPQALDLEPTDWFSGGEVNLHAMHQDVVTAVPPGAVVIGRGETADVPAYLVGDAFFCVQDHPEFSDAYSAALIEDRSERLGPELTAAAMAKVGRVECDGDLLARWIVGFLRDERIA